ncbi:MAG: AI-2E family transporter [Acidimicrobiia bacterium]|nr:AI-2E family transporter [Acidimicrobiia bacterium]
MADPTTDTRFGVPVWVIRAILFFFAITVGWFYLRGVLSSLRPLFIILAISFFLSFAIEPVVNRLERLGVRRGVGTWIVFLGLIGIGVGFGFAVGTALAEQINQFVEDAPATIDDLERWLQDNVDESFDLTEFQNQFLENGTVRDQLTNLAGNLLSFGTTLLSWLLQAFTIALFTWYLVAEGPELRRKVCSLLPPTQQHEVLRAWNLAIAKTGGYILSRGILALLSAMAHWLAFLIIDIPVPLALALFVGVVSQFIPVVGTYIAGAIPIAVAVADEPINGLWVLIVVVIYQQIENYVFGPRIQARTMEIHVALAFGAVIAGGYILGPIGALLGVPAAATIQAFTSTYLQTYDVVDAAQDLP